MTGSDFTKVGLIAILCAGLSWAFEHEFVGLLFACAATFASLQAI